MRHVSSLALAGWLDESDVDVWKNTTGGDSSILKKLVQLLVISDGELNVSWDDSSLLGVLGGVTSELEDLGGEVLKDGGEVDWGAGADSSSGSVLLEESGDSTDWELETSSSSLGHSSGSGGLTLASSGTFSSHSKK